MALSRNNRDNFFSSYDWYDAFTEHCMEAGAEPLFVYGVGEQTDNPAFVLLPLRTPAHQPGSHLPAAVPRFGSVASLTNFQSVYFAPVVEPGSDHAGAVRLLSGAFKSQLKRFATIDLNHCDPRSGAGAMLAGAAKNAGFAVSNCGYRPIMFETVKGKSFQDYYAGRSSKLRYKIRHAERSLSKDHDVTFHLYDDDKDILTHIQAYEAIQASSWKDDEPFPRFTRETLRRAAASKALRLGFLAVDGVPVATQTLILNGKNASGYKTHYNKDFAKSCVGLILMSKMLQHLIDNERLEEIDFGVGDEPYKSQWISQTRQLENVVAFNVRTIQGAAAHVAYSTAQTTQATLRLVKDAVKKTLAATH